jgi:hypothetical protein
MHVLEGRAGAVSLSSSKAVTNNKFGILLAVAFANALLRFSAPKTSTANLIWMVRSF